MIPRLDVLNTPSGRRRRKQLEKHIPDVYNFRRLLYVGGSPYRLEALEGFVFRKYEIDLLEVWPENVEKLRAINRKWGIFREVIQGDVREVETAIPEGRTYDIVMWWHGPEHVPKKSVAPTLERIEDLAGEMVILGTPRGKYKQDAEYGNPYEQHRSFLREGFFFARGYAVNGILINKTKGSNILAWKRFKCHTWDFL